MDQAWFWVIFTIFVAGALTIDLKVFMRKAHVIELKEALLLSAFWISLALAFGVLVYLWLGPGKALEYMTTYLIEWSLSVDNLFVFLVIFTYFGVPRECQRRVLLWGILGAVFMRASFIFVGIALIKKFHFLIYIFGAFLIFTGIKLGLRKEEEVHPEKNPVLRLFKRFFPVATNYEGEKFFTKKSGLRHATPLFIVLLCVETTDIMFAFDSIPAAFGITLDPFIVYTSNIFAILGLRALFFALAGLFYLFHYLKTGLSFILVFVGIKMVLSDIYKIPTLIALLVVAAILSISVIASVVQARVIESRPASEDPPQEKTISGPAHESRDRGDDKGG